MFSGHLKSLGSLMEFQCFLHTGLLCASVCRSFTHWRHPEVRGGNQLTTGSVNIINTEKEKGILLIVYSLLCCCTSLNRFFIFISL